MQTTRFTHSRGALLVATLATTVFWRTAYPTITWWGSSEYSLAAATLGVISAPGSLLLTLLGWPVAHLPIGASPAHLLNLFAGVLAGLVVALVFIAARRLAAITNLQVAAPGLAAGALAVAFANTLWEHGTMFSPYILSAVFTGLILLVLLRWWQNADEPTAWRHLALLGFLFGLDFSVHRTNALLVPGALAWILFRNPRALRLPLSWIGGAAGLLGGLALHLLVIPLAAWTRSPLNFSSPHNWDRFWSFVSLESLGGGFLLQLFPRKSPFLSNQVADFLRVLGENFLGLNGSAPVLGALPAIAAGYGGWVLWRRDRRFAGAFLTLVLLQGAATVTYFNISADYFRSLDRHYLPVCVTIGVLVAVGLGDLLVRYAERRVLIAAAAVLVPAVQLLGNWSAHDASKRFFARDYAVNALRALPPNTIYFTIGDNDTFPLLYMQFVEGFRRDVTVVNLSVANFPEYPELLRRIEPEFPSSLSRVQRDLLRKGALTDVDITLRDIETTNRLRRPLAFSITVPRSELRWFESKARNDGLFRLVATMPDAPANLLELRKTLAHEYRGFSDDAVRVDRDSRNMAFAYYEAFATLMKAERAAGNTSGCREARRVLNSAIPPGRIGTPAEYATELKAICGDT